jgi:16S rRNA (adenine1518-N6/adenine1519-N6)-dimethyltransferase
LLEQLDVNPQARAEDLSVQQWVALSNLLTDFRPGMSDPS